jgi:thiol-disulfide isomerase/thioredoxin
MTLLPQDVASLDPRPLSRAGHARLRLAALLCALLLSGLSLSACRQPETDPISGIWQATVRNKAGEEVAFKLDLKREGDQVVGALVNGQDRVESTSGSFDGETLKLRYDFYDGELTATLAQGELRGEFTRQWKKEKLRRELRAWRDGAQSKPPRESAASISGDWVLRVGEPGQQRIWRASFQQHGADVTGTIVPLSGDWGTLAGTFAQGQLRLSKFDGINAYLFKARLNERGELEGLLNSERKVIAERVDAAKSGDAPAPPDPSTYAKVKNPAEPFRFSFPDFDGKTVSAADARFRDKVMIVTIGGSWCPNCHDEAPVLNELYDRYQARGLEIVGLFFEYTGDAARDREQIRIFTRRHQIRYPMLLAGTTDEGEIERALPQLVNFGGYPTTIFLGRDGRVKKIHTGFEGPATGPRFTQLKAELDELVRALLEEPES